MQNEDLVSYEQAVKLKATGFDEPCRYYYSPKGILRPAKDNALSPEALNNRFLDEIADGVCTAVPLWQAQKWLREVKDIDIIVTIEDESDNPYQVEVYGSKICISPRWENGFFAKYEQALSAGITAALELIETRA